MRMLLPLSLGLAVVAAIPAQAQSTDRNATHAIAAGDYGRAEQTLLGELRIYPDRPELLLNLAAVYARTGRTADARALYRQVLDQRDVTMDLAADRTAGSHAIAHTGLKRLDTVQLTSN